MRRAARIYVVDVNRVAYPIWLGLLAIRVAIVVAGLCLLLADWAISQAQAGTASANAATLRQRGIRSFLDTMPSEQVRFVRGQCASGDTMIVRATRDAYGLGAASICVTALTRLGREGTLAYAGGADAGPAYAFDKGFVSGYLKREALPAGAPTMAVLLPVAERCMARSPTEVKAELCHAAGYMIGLRAAQGETVPVS